MGSQVIFNLPGEFYCIFFKPSDYNGFHSSFLFQDFDKFAITLLHASFGFIERKCERVTVL